MHVQGQFGAPRPGMAMRVGAAVVSPVAAFAAVTDARCAVGP